MDWKSTHFKFIDLKSKSKFKFLNVNLNLQKLDLEEFDNRFQYYVGKKKVQFTINL